MPNTGKPSRGCKECKARKVKCDQTSPACQRCQRNSRQCSGYPAPLDIALRNTFSTNVTHYRRLSPLSDNARHHSYSIVPIPMTRDWRHQAVCMFFHDYLVVPRESAIGTGFLQNVPELFTKEPEMSALTKAVSAVALTSLAHRTSLDCLSAQARQQYGTALSLLNKSLRTQQAVKADSTLAAILCLDIYETISGETAAIVKLWSCHIDILELILRARGADQSYSTESHSLTYNALVYLQMRNLSQHIRPNREIEALVRSPIREPAPRRLGALVCETCHLLARADNILSKSMTTSEVLNSLLETISNGAVLDQKLEAWADDLPGSYRYNSFHIPDYSLENTLGLPSFHLYSNISIAASWNLNRITRMILLTNVGRWISALAKDSAQETTSTENNDYNVQNTDKIQSLVGEICASVPYLLGELDQEGKLQHPQHTKAIGGLFLLFPLRTMLFIESIDPVQRAWIRKRLAYVKNALGIQRALPD